MALFFFEKNTQIIIPMCHAVVGKTIPAMFPTLSHVIVLVWRQYCYFKALASNRDQGFLFYENNGLVDTLLDWVYEICLSNQYLLPSTHL